MYKTKTKVGSSSGNANNNGNRRRINGNGKTVANGNTNKTTPASAQTKEIDIFSDVANAVRDVFGKRQNIVLVLSILFAFIAYFYNKENWLKYLKIHANWHFHTAHLSAKYFHHFEMFIMLIPLIINFKDWRLRIMSFVMIIFTLTILEDTLFKKEHAIIIMLSTILYTRMSVNFNRMVVILIAIISVLWLFPLPVKPITRASTTPLPSPTPD